MNYYNLKIVALLKQDLDNFSAYEKISNLISLSMLKDNNLKQIHEQNTYKNYVFCNLYPIEKDSIYKKNNIYTFDLRGIEIEKILKLKKVMNNAENDYLKVIQIIFQTNQQREIKKLITLTPTIITTEKGDYDIKDNLEFVKQRILANTQKKYKNIFKDNVNIDFIKDIKKTNVKPIKIPYKNINILGNKFELFINEDKMSQDLAFLILSIGCLEKNAIGFRIL